MSTWQFTGSFHPLPAYGTNLIIQQQLAAGHMDKPVLQGLTHENVVAMTFEAALKLLVMQIRIDEGL